MVDDSTNTNSLTRVPTNNKPPQTVAGILTTALPYCPVNAERVCVLLERVKQWVGICHAVAAGVVDTVVGDSDINNR